MGMTRQGNAHSFHRIWGRMNRLLFAWGFLLMLAIHASNANYRNGFKQEVSNIEEYLSHHSRAKRQLPRLNFYPVSFRSGGEPEIVGLAGEIIDLIKAAAPLIKPALKVFQAILEIFG